MRGGIWFGCFVRGCHHWILMGVQFTLGGEGYPQYGVAGSWRGGTGSWLLSPLVLMSRVNGTPGDDTQIFSIVGGGVGSDGRAVPRCGLWRNIPWRHWLVASGAHSGSWLGGSSRDGMVPWREFAETYCAQKVNNVKCEDAGALGRRAIFIADETIRTMEPMVILALPPPSRLTKRRT